MIMLLVKIPKVGVISAATLETLGDAAWNAVHNAPNGYGTGYGCSEVGSGWPVSENGVIIGKMSYNGRFWPNAVAS
jgi:hypothetical protein